MVLTRGFSLIEVMVALLVLAIGVLGILTLQLVTLRTTRDAAFQSSALRLATDVAEQVGGSTRSAEMLQQFAQFDYVADETATDSGGHCYGADSICTPAQIASAAMREWRQRLRETLPHGRIRICRDASPWQGSSKTMRWECGGADSGSGASMPLWIKIGWPVPTAFAASTTPSTSPQLVLPVAAFSR